MSPLEKRIAARDARTFAATIEDLRRRIRRIETQSQLARSSIEDGALTAHVGGQLTLTVGQQYDGTNTVTTQSSLTPPTPSAPTVLPTTGGAVVLWDGTYASGPTTVAPMDWARVDVVASAAPAPDFIGTPPLQAFTSPRGGQVFIALPEGQHQVALVTRSHSGAPSTPSVAVSVTALETAPRVFRQPTAPVNDGTFRAGHVWYDTDDLSKMYVWSTAANDWVEAGSQVSQDIQNAITQAQADADQALTDAAAASGIATAASRSFRQPTMPTQGALGWTWFNTSDPAQTRMFVHNGTTYVESGLAGAADVQAAQAAAATDATTKAANAQAAAATDATTKANAAQSAAATDATTKAANAQAAAATDATTKANAAQSAAATDATTKAANAQAAAATDATTKANAAQAAAAADATTKAAAAILSAEAAASDLTTLSGNSAFEDWTGTYPTGHTAVGSVLPTKETTLVRTGRNALRWVTTAAAGADDGTNSGGSWDQVPYSRYVVFEMDLYLTSGNLDGTGLYIYWGQTFRGASANHATSVALRDYYSGTPPLNQWFTVRIFMEAPAAVVAAPATQFTRFNGHFFANANMGGGRSAKDLILDRLALRHATPAEIEAHLSVGRIATAQAAAATDATTKANAAQAAAASDATTKAANAQAAAATDATTKANAAQAAAATDATTKAANAQAAAAADATTKADAAQSAAASDATTKAANAQAAAATDATTKANAAQAAAATDATTKAANAQAAAATDASTKASAAQAAAATDATAKAAAAIAAGQASTWLSKNQDFSAWTGAAPSPWSVFGAAVTKETTLTRVGGNAVRWVTDAVADRYITATSVADFAGADYVTIEADVRLESGTFSGAGMLLDFNTTANRAFFSFRDAVPDASVALGNWYRLTKVMKKPASLATSPTSYPVYVMANWSGFSGAPRAAKDMIVDRFAMRPSTAAEIDAHESVSRIATAQAAAATDATTKANAAQAAAASDATTKAANAQAAAATDATTKADAAQSAAATDATTKAANAQAAAATDATTKANAAQAAAATDATTKAANAQAAAATDATTKANAAQTAAATDATAKAAAAIAAGQASTWLSKNQDFSDWTGLTPAAWAAAGGAPAKETALARVGNAARWVTDASVNRWLISTTVSDFVGADYVTVEVDARLESGNFSGAGVLFEYDTSIPGRVFLPFDTIVPSAQVALGNWYRFTRTIKKPAAIATSPTSYRAYIMADWTGFAASPRSAKDLVVDRFAMRPATAAEIEAYESVARIATAQSAAATDATDKANAAQTAAAADATTKAANAQTNAINTAATDATTKANNAVTTSSTNAETAFGATRTQVNDWKYPGTNLLDGGDIQEKTVTTNVLNVVMGGGNLLSNSSFEAPTLQNWQTGGGTHTLTRSTVRSRHGGASLLSTVTAVGATRIQQPLPTPLQVTPGEKISVASDIYADGPGRSIKIEAFVTSASGPLYPASPSFTSLTGSWTRGGGVITMPAGAQTITHFQFVVTGSDAGDKHHFDAVQMERGDVPTAYSPRTDEILPGTISTPMLVATAIDGMTVTGALLQTVATANRGIKMNATTFVAYNNTGAATMSIDGPTGAISTVGELLSGAGITGSTVTGGTVQTESTAARGVKINSAGLTAYNGTGTATFAITAATGAVSMLGALTTGSTIAGTDITGGSVTGATLQTEATAARGIKISSTGLTAYNGTGTPTLTVTASTGAVSMLGDLTTGSTITGATVTGGTVQTESTASRGVKVTSAGLTAYNGTGTPTFTITASTGAVSMLGALTTGSTISGTGITGSTVTGGTVQTEATASRGVKIDSTGLTAYNGTGTPTFTITASTGAVSMLGALTTGSTISGTGITGSTVTGGTVQTEATASRGVKITSTGLTAFDGAGTPTFTITAATGAVSMLGALTTGSTIAGTAITGSTVTGGTVQTEATASRGVKVTSTGLTAYNATGTATFTIAAADGAVSMLGALTTGSTISGTGITGSTVTGGTVQTEATAARGIKITSTGLTAFNGTGTPTLTITAATGAVSMLGDLTSGSTITGATVTGGTLQTESTAARGVKITSTGLTAFNGTGTPTFTITASTGAVSMLGALNTGSTIAGTDITGGTVTGATVQTEITAARGVKVTSTGLTAFNGTGTPTFTITASTGAVSMLGALTTGSTISGTAVTGSTVTGGTVQTEATAARGIKIDSTGLTAYNGTGTATFTVTASTGAVSMLGALTSGSTISGTGITGSTVTGGTVQTEATAARGIKITSTGLTAYNATGTATFTVAAADGAVSMLGALTSGSTISGTGITGSTVTGGTVQTEATASRGVKITSTGLTAFDGAGTPTFTITAATGAVSMLGALTTGSTISGTAITGGSVTGATLQTEVTAARGIKISSTGLTAYNGSGVATFTVAAADGAVSMLGALTTGSTITGATVTGGTLQTESTASRGVKITSGGLTAFNGSGVATFTITAATGAIAMLGSITSGSTISGTGITGSTVTGGTVQTETTAARGIKMDSTGLTAYNGTGTPMLTITAATGAIAMQGSLTSGSTISGTTLTGSTVTGGTLQTEGTADRGIKITSTGLTAYNGTGTPMFTITAATGAVSMLGALTTGSTISGTAVTGSTVTGGTLQTEGTADRGIKITSTGLTAYSGTGVPMLTVTASTGAIAMQGSLTSGSTISSATVTGGVLQTESTPSRGIKIDSSGLIAYSGAGVPMLTITASTGSISMQGSLTSGSTITGATITGAGIQTDPAADRGVKITSSGIYGYDTAGVANFAVTTAGALTVRGTIQSGSTIAGATLTGAIQTDAAAARGIKMTNTGIYAYDSVTGSPTLGQVTLQALSATGAVTIKGAITASTIDGSTVTGGTVQTESTPARGVKITSEGITAFDSVAGSPTLGQATFTLLATTGQAAFKGTIQSGSTITGSTITGTTITTGATPTGPRVEIGGTRSDVRFYSGHPTETSPAAVDGTFFSDPGSDIAYLNIFAPRITGMTSGISTSAIKMISYFDRLTSIPSREVEVAADKTTIQGNFDVNARMKVYGKLDLVSNGSRPISVINFGSATSGANPASAATAGGIVTLDHNMGLSGTYQVLLTSRNNGGTRVLTVTEKNLNNFKFRIDNDAGAPVTAATGFDYLILAE